MSELSPCPSCHNGARVRITDYTPTTKIRVECNMCILRTSDYYYPEVTYNKMVEIWNRMVANGKE